MATRQERRERHAVRDHPTSDCGHGALVGVDEVEQRVTLELPVAIRAVDRHHVGDAEPGALGDQRVQLDKRRAVALREGRTERGLARTTQADQRYALRACSICRSGCELLEHAALDRRVRLRKEPFELRRHGTVYWVFYEVRDAALERIGDLPQQANADVARAELQLREVPL